MVLAWRLAGKVGTTIAAVFQRAGEIEFRTLQTPEPAGAEVLVRVIGCTLCASDLHSFEGRRQVPMPTILGHEIVGEIVAFGPDAQRLDLVGSRLNVGDRVSWAVVANCDECYFCIRGLPQKCLHSIKYGHQPMRPGAELLGGLAQHCLLVRGTKIMRWSEDVPLAVACPASCATATAMAALEAAGEIRGRSIAVLGAGMLGLTSCAIAAVKGAAKVVCVDPSAERRERSTSFGATLAADISDIAEVKDRITDRHGFDAVIEMSGAASAFQCAYDNVRTGGALVLVGSVFPAPPVPLLTEMVVRRCLKIQGIHNYTPTNFLTAVEFLSQVHSQFPFASLVSTWKPLREVREALHLAGQLGAVRIGIAF